MVAVAPVAVSGVVSNMTITSLSSSAPPMTAHTSTVPVCSTTATDCGGSTEMVPTEERERERASQWALQLSIAEVCVYQLNPGLLWCDTVSVWILYADRW